MHDEARKPVVAVVFDFFFTLAEPGETDLGELARAIGCSGAVEDIEAARARYYASRSAGPPVFEGPPAAFRSFRDEWILAGDAIFDGFGVSGAGNAFAVAREEAHRMAVPYSDVALALTELRASGAKLGVLSDADTAYLRAAIRRLGFTFDAVVTSEDLQLYKPHRRCFNAACARLRTDPRRTVYVGDSPVHDIEGSRRAGMHPVWINRRALSWPDDLQTPDRAVSKLTELIDHVQLDDAG